MVTIVSLRLSMKRIVQTVCGVLCEEVVVVTPRQFEPRMYLVQQYAETLMELNFTLPRHLPTHGVEQDTYALAE
jgi:hypothetical protein